MFDQLRRLAAELRHAVDVRRVDDERLGQPVARAALGGGLLVLRLAEMLRGEFVDLHGLRAEILHALRGEPGFDGGEVVLQFAFGLEQRRGLGGKIRAPDDEVGAHIAARGAADFDELGFVDARPRAGEDERGEAETGGEEQQATA